MQPLERKLLPGKSSIDGPVQAFAERVEVADDPIRIMETKRTLLGTLVTAKA